MRFTVPTTTQSSFEFAFPAKPGNDFPLTNIDVDSRLQETVDLWHAATQRVQFQIPDERMMASLPVSVGYLLLASDPDGPHPGALAHNAIWTRDAAYMGLALLQAGHAETVRGYLDSIFAGQGETGKIPPIQGEAVPWDDDEWDSQGQAIFLAVIYTRYTDDVETLQKFYPQIIKAAQFIKDLRQANTAADATQGLLPPSLSAEDLGPADQHYYWDNLWAVAGLEEAAWAARILEHSDDEAWLQAEADDLRQAILDSVTSVMGEDAAYIPVAVEDQDSSGMARGTTPALWMTEVLSPQSPLIQRSFEHYYRTWIEPYNGAYRHREGQFWTYGGIELAHAYQRLGRGEVVHQILGWTLSNQTLPNTYAWAEQVRPENGGFSGGDMPHAWASASYFTLIREMLVMEGGDTLQLFTTAPEGWFEAGRVVSLANAPTQFGVVDLRTESTVEVVDDRWVGELTLTISGAMPPDGFVWELSRVPSEMDAPPGTYIEDFTLYIPATGGEIKLVFAN